jgi:hypothetical protein
VQRHRTIIGIIAIALMAAISIFGLRPMDLAAIK